MAVTAKTETVARGSSGSDGGGSSIRRVGCLVRMLELGRAEDDLDARGGADAGGAGLDHGLRLLTGPHSAGGLDSHLGAHGLAHQADMLDGRAHHLAVRVAGEAGGGLDERRAGLLGRDAGLDDLRLGQLAGLKDDLHRDRSGGVDDRRDLAAHEQPVAALDVPDVHDHVDLIGAVVHGISGLEDLGRGRHGSQREADHGHDLRGRAVGGLEIRRRLRYIAAVDAHAREAVLHPLLTEPLDIGRSCLRPQVGVIEIPCQFSSVHVRHLILWL